MKAASPFEPPCVVALATPLGTAALAVIRMTGAGSHEIFAQAATKNLIPRQATFCRIKDAQSRVLDEVVACYFAAPASFTGEDVVEISCHGGILVVRRVIERLMACGAQAAEPGEFSRRAFENGKLDLTQAEAIMDVIAAGSDLALRAAQNQLGGAISTQVQLSIDELLRLMAHVEAYIDFPEEDISPDTTLTLCDGLSSIGDALKGLLSTADEGRLLREGLRTAIVGAPNAGKSSLLNCLLGFDRAIVSELAGTTRDTIEERVNLGGLCLRLIDTAGLRESNDAIELAGMERSRRAGSEADLVLQVIDASAEPDDLELPEGGKSITLLNKCDLGIHASWQPILEAGEAIAFSCASGQGREGLETRIEQLFLQGHAELDSLAAINLRHRAALDLALDYLNAGIGCLQQGMSPEFCSMELRDCLEALGSISGKVDTEELLGAIFSQFCLGK